jgi:hypothetical protein
MLTGEDSQQLIAQYQYLFEAEQEANKKDSKQVEKEEEEKRNAESKKRESIVEQLAA